VVLLEGPSATTLAEILAADILEALRRPFLLNGVEVFNTASIGITSSRVAYLEPAEVLRDADTAMYRAKTSGKDRFVVFDPSMHEQACVRLQIETELRRAVDRKELRLHYQPIVSLEDGRIVGLEALVRWKHPVRGLVAPSAFIPIAEETGLICVLGQWVFEEACRQLAEFGGSAPMPTISI